MVIKADLHIHTCLSPCGSLEMAPSAIAQAAKQANLDLVSIADHNSALNCPAFSDACKKEGLWAMFGLEVTSLEEAHLLCVFETVDKALEFGELIYSKLPEFPNNPEVLGDQVYVDSNDDIIGEVEKYLGNATELSIDEIREEVFSRSGLFIPAHIDKPVFSITSQLGFLPDDIYTAIEVFFPASAGKYSDKYSVITSSDAHFLDDIGKKYFTVDIAEKTFLSVLLAMREKKSLI
ncbi:MAG: PHP domain-containing protein [Spirochaetia bacterium]|jgi:PHP family Zn ribbon phosphoesterase|nr:PHP domain-containing protein [Spirochaetia bacterium]